MNDKKVSAKGNDFLEKIFSHIKEDELLQEDEKSYILSYLDSLERDIISIAGEISAERNHTDVMEKDLEDAIKRVIPSWEPDPSYEKIVGLIEKNKENLVKMQRDGGWGAYRSWMSAAKLPKEMKKWDIEPPIRIWDTATTIISLLNVNKLGNPKFELKNSKAIQDGVKWLKAQVRNSDGGYPYLPNEYWKYLPPDYSPIQSSIYETSYATIAVLEAGEEANSDFIKKNLDFLLNVQDRDYRAWGATPYEEMNVGATSCALIALLKAGTNPEAECIQSAVQWLKDNQREDGGWSDTWKRGSDESLITKTYDAISALLFAGSKIEEEVIQKGIQYLLVIQDFIKNERGEWGWVWAPDERIEISNIENTATAIITLLKAGIKTDDLAIKMGIRWLLGNRDINDSWGKDTPRVIICLSEYLKKRSYS